MIEAKELRIGNLVMLDTSITPPSPHKITASDLDYIERDLLPDFTKVSPIPLTEEWLLKLGFHRHHADYSNGVIFIKNVPNETQFLWGVYPDAVGSGYVVKDAKELKHVHQLQNLYFAICGEELTIKEPK